MPRIEFDELPGDARVWIFSAARKLTEPEQARLLAEVDAFINQWGAHAVPLTAGRDLVYGQFLFIAVDQRAAGPSGCSIDALVRRMQELQEEIDVELVNHAPVLFRQGEAIARVPRDAFARLADAGKVGPDTTVFNNTLTSLGEVRAGRWEVPAADSWHAQAFF
ncbi:MAG: ABC transporter ATPase [Acidobacteria bacterium]|nr:ABC transporter ATPase [Acidobacteriota bacterium]MYD70803.1 ABC transporter ATPase [Acidobacteriota bacterium]MYJ06298.1 ABC transporter ATPase [Acidobacteriota bacterium]